MRKAAGSATATWFRSCAACGEPKILAASSRRCISLIPYLRDPTQQIEAIMNSGKTRFDKSFLDAKRRQLMALRQTLLGTRTAEQADGHWHRGSICDVKRGSAAHSRRMLLKKETLGRKPWSSFILLEASVFFALKLHT